MVMIPAEVQAQIEAELAQAEVARQASLEGRARVNARRAAGLAVRAALVARGMAVNNLSLLDSLKLLHDDPETTSEVRQILEHLLARVNPDFTLASEFDLISETRLLFNMINKE